MILGCNFTKRMAWQLRQKTAFVDAQFQVEMDNFICKSGDQASDTF